MPLSCISNSEGLSNLWRHARAERSHGCISPNDLVYINFRIGVGAAKLITAAGLVSMSSLQPMETYDAQ